MYLIIKYIFNMNAKLIDFYFIFYFEAVLTGLQLGTDIKKGFLTDQTMPHCAQPHTHSV